MPDEEYGTVCEECGKVATHWVRDLFAVDENRWMTGKWHAFCEKHWRPSKEVDARSGATKDDGIGYYVN